MYSEKNQLFSAIGYLSNELEILNLNLNRVERKYSLENLNPKGIGSILRVPQDDCYTIILGDWAGNIYKIDNENNFVNQYPNIDSCVCSISYNENTSNIAIAYRSGRVVLTKLRNSDFNHVQ